MRRLALLLSALALGLVLSAHAPPSPAAPAAAGREVMLLRVQGAIGPATADYVERGLARAAQRGDALVVLQLDTPGGLDASMRAIIQAILASPVPVATYVAPSGSRAASAGTYILYASPVAAMAPATTLGAATPVLIGVGAPSGADEARPGAVAASGAATSPASAAVPSAHAPRDAMEAKRVNDAAAYVRGLAMLHGRNADWAERAVREAVALPASEALAQHVVDVIAVDVPDLLRQVDGRVVHGAGGRTATLATAGAVPVAWDPDWRDRLLAVIADPSLALLLMMVGFYGLLFEFANPGYMVPGVVGGTCLLLGLFGMQTLPIHGAGLALVLLGMGFFAAEAFVPSHGALGIGGVVAFVLGALLLVDTDTPGFGVSRVLIGALAVVSLGFVGALSLLAARIRRRAAVSGTGTLVGVCGELLEASGTEGWMLLQGERWRVRASAALQAGARVRVTRVEGLVLEVERVIEGVA